MMKWISLAIAVFGTVLNFTFAYTYGHKVIILALGAWFVGQAFAFAMLGLLNERTRASLFVRSDEAKT